MAFQASLHGFPDMNQQDNYASPKLTSGRQPLAFTIEESRSEGGGELNESDELDKTNTLPSDPTDQDAASVSEKDSIDPGAVTHDGGVRECARKERPSPKQDAQRWSLLATRSNQATTGSTPDVKVEERRSSLMALFRSPKAPRRRRSSMFQNMVNWVRTDDAFFRKRVCTCPIVNRSLSFHAPNALWVTCVRRPC